MVKEGGIVLVSLIVLVISGANLERRGRHVEKERLRGGLRGTRTREKREQFREAEQVRRKISISFTLATKRFRPAVSLLRREQAGMTRFPVLSQTLRATRRERESSAGTVPSKNAGALTRWKAGCLRRIRGCSLSVPWVLKNRVDETALEPS